MRGEYGGYPTPNEESKPAAPGSANHQAFDGYSALHFTTGAMMGAMGYNAGLAFTVHVFWEIGEIQLKRSMHKAFPLSTTDSMANKVGDTLIFMAGWWFGHRRWGSK